MPSRFSAFLNNSIMKAHKAIGHIVKGAATFTPHAKKGLATLSKVAKYIGNAGLHPYLSIAGKALSKGADIGVKLINKYEPHIQDLASNYPQYPPQITSGGIQYGRMQQPIIHQT